MQIFWGYDFAIDEGYTCMMMRINDFWAHFSTSKMTATISSISLRCPVTALALVKLAAPFSVEEREILFAGTGPYLKIYDFNEPRREQLLASIKIFESENIHGIRLICDGVHKRIFVFGLYCAEIYDIGHRVGDSMDRSITRSERFSLIPVDMILDAAVHQGKLMIGHGQNFIRLYDLKTGGFEGTLQSSVICVLFSLAIGSCLQHATIPIASGTASGIIYIWHVRVSMESMGGGAAALHSPDVVLRGHEGVVSKMAWNHDYTRLASVSDDRSVRLWDTATGAQLFIGWGHTCRVWDVLFYGSHEDELMTSGEDLMIKVWNVRSGRCEATMEGHVGKSSWCIAYSPACDCIISGGNDSSIKLWKISRQRFLCSDLKMGEERELIGDRSRPVFDVNMKDILENEIPVALKLSPDSQEILVVTQSGYIFVIPLLYIQRPDGLFYFNKFGSIETHKIHNLVQVHVVNFFFDATDCHSFCVFSGHTDGSVALNVFRGRRLVACLNWQAHRWRTIDQWVVGNASDHVTVATTSVGGELKLWSVAVTFESVFKLSVSCLCVLSMCKNQIVNSCCLLRSDGSRQMGCNGLIAGGCKGGIAYFNSNVFSEFSATDSKLAIQANFSIVHAHGQGKVIRVTEAPGGFLSSGSDGKILVYGFKDEIVFFVRTVIDCGVISFPEMFVIPPISRHDSFNLDPAFACGFQSNVYRIWDVMGKYELLRVEAGGWRRLHDCVLVPNPCSNCFPSAISFASLDCTGRDPILSLHAVADRSTTIETEDIRSVSLTTLPMNFGHSSNGRVMYTGVFVGGEVSHNRYVAAAGEEGIIKLFNLPALSLVQEVKLLSECPIRTMCSAALDDNCGILVAAGGRLSFGVWIYHLHAGEHFAPVVNYGCTGQAPKHATQDHRVLSSYCWCLSTDENVFAITLCDSRGCLRIFQFSMMTSKLHFILEKNISDFPLLSCQGLSWRDPLSHDKSLLIVGDTTGKIFFYLISSKATDGSSSADFDVIDFFSYQGHTMGANVIDAADVTVCGSATLAGAISKAMRYIVVCSGGDDQSLAISLLSLDLNSPQKQFLSAFKIFRADNVIGSAIKGVRLVEKDSPQIIVACTGLDQRLTLWSYDKNDLFSALIPNATGSDVANINEVDSLPSRSPSCPFKFLSGSCIHVADIGCMVSIKEPRAGLVSDSALSYWCAIIGEGLEIVSLRLSLQENI